MQSGVGGLNVDINELKGSAINLHSPPKIDTDLIKGRSVCYSTVSPVEGLEGVEFLIPPDPECFYILNQTRLSGHFVVSTKDGVNVASSDNVTLTHHWAACLFSQIEIYLNGTQVCDLSAPVIYPYKHYIDTALSYHFNVNNNVGKAEGNYLSEREYCYFNIVDGAVASASCEDRKEFHNMITDGKKVYFNSTIPADIFHTDKYLPPNIEIKIKLARFNPAFGITQKEADKHFVIMLKDLKLEMRKVLPSERVRNRFQTKLLQKPCFLPYKDSQLKHFHIPEGSSSFSANLINNHILPKHIFFAFVQSKGLKRDKYHFEHLHLWNCNLSSVNLKINGKPVHPKLLECNFQNGDIVELYEHFQSNVGTKNTVTLKNYSTGYTILAFDLTPDKCNSFHNHPPIAGNLELDLTFKTNIFGAFTMMSYAFYDSGISIDKNLQVTKMKY